jgi:23S rRNA-intervening sequence protein
MGSNADFDTLRVYQAVAEMAAFIDGLEDRFPGDEIPLLYDPLRAAAVQVGARIAAGFGRDGVDERGDLSDETMREARSKLGELRHYILTARSRFFLDEKQLETFETYYERILDGLRPGPARR